MLLKYKEKIRCINVSFLRHVYQNVCSQDGRFSDLLKMQEYCNKKNVRDLCQRNIDCALTLIGLVLKKIELLNESKD